MADVIVAGAGRSAQEACFPDDYCQVLIDAWNLSARYIQGFTYFHNEPDRTLHMVRDLRWAKRGNDILWSGGPGLHDEMQRQCKIYRMRFALNMVKAP